MTQSQRTRGEQDDVFHIKQDSSKHRDWSNEYNLLEQESRNVGKIFMSQTRLKILSCYHKRHQIIHRSTFYRIKMKNKGVTYKFTKFKTKTQYLMKLNLILILESETKQEVFF